MAAPWAFALLLWYILNFPRVEMCVDGIDNLFWCNWFHYLLIFVDDLWNFLQCSGCVRLEVFSTCQWIFLLFLHLVNFNCHRYSGLVGHIFLLCSIIWFLFKKHCQWFRHPLILSCSSQTVHSWWTWFHFWATHVAYLAFLAILGSSFLSFLRNFLFLVPDFAFL